MVLCALMVFLASAWGMPWGTNINWPLGNPSGAGVTDMNNYYLDEKYFVESYNNAKCEPNWVAWHLTSSDLGEAPRYSFYASKDLPRGFQIVKPKDYYGSGFDRGHLCNHSDRAADIHSSKATFTMINMVPQAPWNNRKTWESLEVYCRELVRKGKTLWIVSGPAGAGGDGAKGYREYIGVKKRIVVPKYIWKVVLVAGDKSNKRYDRIISVIIPNSQNIMPYWKRYAVSESDVEKLTGFVFFSEWLPVQSPAKYMTNAY